MAFTRWCWLRRGLQALVLALCVISLGPGPSPASAGGSSVQLAASDTSVPDGTSVTLTATAAYDVGPTPYYIEIYDLATGQLLNYCGRGTTCSATVVRSTPSTGRYRAYIAGYATQPPASYQGISFEVDVFWSAVAVGLFVSGNGPLMLNATSAEDVGPTPYYIEIFNLTTGSLVAMCGSGTTCSGPAATTGATQTYQAFVAGYSTAPPTSFQGASKQVTLGGKG